MKKLLWIVFLIVFCLCSSGAKEKESVKVIPKSVVLPEKEYANKVGYRRDHIDNYFNGVTRHDMVIDHIKINGVRYIIVSQYNAVAITPDLSTIK